MSSCEHSIEIVEACAIARGEKEAPLEPLGRFRAASKDVSARGSVREWWFRMRWTGSTWDYFGEGRLPSGTFLAADRRATTYGPVYAGDVLICHDRGKGIDTGAEAARLITHVAGGKIASESCQVAKLRNGQLRITLPDGTTIDRPNPRSK